MSFQVVHFLLLSVISTSDMLLHETNKAVVIQTYELFSRCTGPNTQNSPVQTTSNFCLKLEGYRTTKPGSKHTLWFFSAVVENWMPPGNPCISAFSCIRSDFQLVE